MSYLVSEKLNSRRICSSEYPLDKKPALGPSKERRACDRAKLAKTSRVQTQISAHAGLAHDPFYASEDFVCD